MADPTTQPIVVLTPAECLLAANVAAMRQVQNMRDQRANAYGEPYAWDWEVHIGGAFGECAVAKYLNIFWSGAIGNLKADDVGAFQVRTSRREQGCLILHPKDPDDRPFVLVIGDAPRFRIAGWIDGGAGKRPEWWGDKGTGRPAFFVPQGALRPAVELRYASAW